MVNERPGVDFTEIMAVAQEQLADIAVVQRQQAALTATAAVADGMVQVSVNARGVVVETKIDPEYLDEYDFEELGQDITYAAQLAAQDVNRRAAALMEPLLDRRAELPPLSEILHGAPDLHDFESRIPSVSTAPPDSPERLSLEREPTFPDDGNDNPWHRVRG
ncbi:YbaB/EbfC family nucleoid-associated protein [Mycobacteroides sp. LB1]|uniref:YbaB/EbfC family nucleoid-associated protein n=1 Tax=Mycobacteroides sp. LB1 TaxID=2750814 RepID=UPI0015DEC482|nr:YbaB/EbfC family nucleoid-associated protein [Mycobacteroides sp. LB1]